MSATILRGGKLVQLYVKPEGDPTWTEQDWARSQTLEARWIAEGVSEKERERLLPCAVWKAKFPGLTYSPAVESRLQQLL
jgi:hypothetical protein